MSFWRHNKNKKECIVIGEAGSGMVRSFIKPMAELDIGRNREGIG